MPWFDLPLDQLREYRTDTAEPPELDRWWQLHPFTGHDVPTAHVERQLRHLRSFLR